MDITPEKIEHVLSNPRLKYFNIDIRTEADRMEEEVKKADIVVDLIAVANPAVYVSDPLGVFDLNFNENMKIVKMCVAHKKRLVQFSTCEVYGVTAAQCVGKVHPFTLTHPSPSTQKQKRKKVFKNQVFPSFHL